MTSARSVVLYLFAALAAVAGLALGASAASGCSRISTAASLASYQHFQNTSSPAIAGHITSQRFAAPVARRASATGNPRMSVASERLTSNGNFSGAKRRHRNARRARSGTC